MAPEEGSVSGYEKRLDIYSRGVHNVDAFESVRIVIDAMIVILPQKSGYGNRVPVFLSFNAAGVG